MLVEFRKVINVDDLIPKLKLSTPSSCHLATATPTTSQLLLIIGPPLFPEFSAASV